MVANSGCETVRAGRAGNAAAHGDFPGILIAASTIGRPVPMTSTQKPRLATGLLRAGDHGPESRPFSGRRQNPIPRPKAGVIEPSAVRSAYFVRYHGFSVLIL
ncbi:hypothetical protein TVNIR_3238 [Thioalkalivibrio nitratireducens DSM 14787]|uniref:Uncharacterized protein n=1 Tax=Thioalkalivibrio nitratireducens (strain DSM 14787 / UNIQEM 213 / ALEN2) TaxID=1255043 RepID=L0E104_THIND|nr:hypothetical protein TVNIR_3238 [Thioalkalivibrio nitratireducens DSM 14787]